MCQHYQLGFKHFRNDIHSTLFGKLSCLQKVFNENVKKLSATRQQWRQKIHCEYFLCEQKKREEKKIAR